MNGSSRDAKRVGNDANPAPQETKTIPEIAKPEVGHPGSQRYERDDDQLEFGRVVNYSDAVFAIASTLLVVGIGIPTVQAGRLPDQLSDLGLEIMSFFISFLVIGYYWMAHHRFVAAVRCFDTGLISLNLVYLGIIAFVPFPTALVGSFEDQPVAVVLYAVTLAVASGMETLMFYWARLHKLLKVEVPTPVFRFGVLASLLPVAVFGISVPIAYANTTIALLSWILVYPLEKTLDIFRPTESGAIF